MRGCGGGGEAEQQGEGNVLVTLLLRPAQMLRVETPFSSLENRREEPRLHTTGQYCFGGAKWRRATGKIARRVFRGPCLGTRAALLHSAIGCGLNQSHHPKDNGYDIKKETELSKQFSLPLPSSCCSRQASSSTLPRQTTIVHTPPVRYAREKHRFQPAHRKQTTPETTPSSRSPIYCTQKNNIHYLVNPYREEKIVRPGFLGAHP